MDRRPEIDVTKIEDYDERWPEIFELGKRKIVRALGDSIPDTQHIGSTAVPGMAAKPFIDILVAVEDMSSGLTCCRNLTDIGYRNVPHDEDSERLFLYKGMPRTHHIHIVRYGGPTYLKHIAFRDYIRQHKVVREEYDQLKRNLASKFRNDRKAYVDGKAIFIERITEKALRER